MTPPTDRATRIPLIVTTALLAATGAGIVTAGPAAADGWTVTHPTYVGDAAPSPTPVRTTYPPKWIPPQPSATVEPAAASPMTPGPAAPAKPRWTVQHAELPPAAPSPVPARAVVPARTIGALAAGHHAVPHRVAPHHVHPGHVAPTSHHRHPGGRVWHVTAGETLSGIAAIWGVTVDQAARANGITNPDRIYDGQILHAPAGAR